MDTEQELHVHRQDTFMGRNKLGPLTDTNARKPDPEGGSYCVHTPSWAGLPVNGPNRTRLRPKVRRGSDRAMPSTAFGGVNVVHPDSERNGRTDH